tara:strand:+ start:125831 stop:126109 length:279 start_codon:yes stop_codon:yes gene_type:complete
LLLNRLFGLKKGKRMMDSSKEDVLEFVALQQVRRKVSNLNKQFLFVLEDLKVDYNIDEERFSRTRKRVLDVGNDTFRELEEYLGNFHIKEKG